MLNKEIYSIELSINYKYKVKSAAIYDEWIDDELEDYYNNLTDDVLIITYKEGCFISNEIEKIDNKTKLPNHILDKLSKDAILFLIKKYPNSISKEFKDSDKYIKLMIDEFI